jgi:hypothetical protein
MRRERSSVNRSSAWPRDEFQGHAACIGWWSACYRGAPRLSPIGDPSGEPNPKWVSNRIYITSNRVFIWKTYFGCQERYNSNLSIFSPEDSFTEMILF